MTKKYSVGYKVDLGKFTKEDLQKRKMGGCDSIIVHSIVLPKDGSRSEMLFTSDGKGAPLDDVEIFKSWVTMARRLSGSDTLSDEVKELTAIVFEAVRDMILGSDNSQSDRRKSKRPDLH